MILGIIILQFTMCLFFTPWLNWLYLRKRNSSVPIDFKAAFDKVWRIGLWEKNLIEFQIKGKCFRVVVNIYNGCRSRIFYNNNFSKYFPCQNGVR